MPQATDQQDLALARLVELSELMLCNAIAGAWGSVIELQKLRDGLVREFFSQPLGIRAEAVVSGVRHMLESDKQLTAAIVEEKKSLQKEIIALKQGKDVSRAYSNTEF